MLKSFFVYFFVLTRLFNSVIVSIPVGNKYILFLEVTMKKRRSELRRQGLDVDRGNMLSVDQAVEQGYGSRSTILGRIYDGDLPSSKVGRMIFMNREDLEDVSVLSTMSDVALYWYAVHRAQEVANAMTREHIKQLIATYQALLDE